MRADLRRLGAGLAAAALLYGASHALAQDGAGTSIGGGPSGVTRDSTPTFSFSSPEAGARFECQLEGPSGTRGWFGCASPLTLELSDGSYVLSVRAVDAAGNADPTPATRAFTVDTGAVDTFIDAGPSGLTNDPTPSFTFGSSVTGATFECRIDGPATPMGAFTACSAPFVAPRLRSGGHVLHVRAQSPGGALDTTPATRSFTVDPDPPDTALTGGPSEGATSTTRTPVFRYESEPGATFDCRLDNREAKGVDTVAWERCATEGFRTPELDGGRHTFEVRAKDAAGNLDPSAAKRSFLVSACQPVVRFGVVEAEGACLRNVGTEDAKRWESSDSVTLNGLPIPVDGSSKLVLEGPTPQRPGGSLSVTDVVLRVEHIVLFRGDLTMKLPDGGVGDTKEVARFDLGEAAWKLFALDITGHAALSLARPGEDSYKSVLSLEVELPGIFSPTPNRGGKLTGKVAIDIDKAGVHLNGLRIQVQNAYIGNLGVKDICLTYLAAGASSVERCKPSMGDPNAPTFIECRSDAGADRWDGALAIMLPTSSQPTELGAWAGLSGGAFSYAGAYVDNLGTLAPIAPGVFLQKVALAVCVKPPPFQVKGEATVGFGPQQNGKPAGAITGSFHYVDAHEGNPWSLETRGSLVLFDRELAKAYLVYRPTGLIDFGFYANLSFDPVTIEGQVDGWIEQDARAAKAGRVSARASVRDERVEPRDRVPTSFPLPSNPGPPPPKGRFNVEGRVKVCLGKDACAQAEAGISSLGVAGCITITGIPIPTPKWVGPGPFHWVLEWQTHPITAGAGYTWGAPLPEVMAGSCSIAQWRIARPAAVSAQDGAGHTFVVPEGSPAIAIRVHGDGAPPRIVLSGPGGRRIASPAGASGAFVQDDHLLAENPGDNTTSVLIAKPRHGTWRVDPLPDSAPIARLDQASVQPPPLVAAHVVGRGHNRALDYIYAPAPGQRVTFVERGPRSERTLGVANGRRCPRRVPKAAAGRELLCASLPFAPADGARGRRKILALVEQDGRPRAQIEVETYVAPPPLRPTKPRDLRLRRVRGGVRVTWKRTRNAARINVVARVSDGRRRLFIRSGRARAARIPAVRRRDGLRVVVRGMRLDGREGRAATARLKPWRKDSRR
jgi:hypothetical protein